MSKLYIPRKRRQITLDVPDALDIGALVSLSLFFASIVVLCAVMAS